MADEVLTVTGKPMPLDLLLFRRFKREVPGLVEATYGRRENRGLARLGPVLPLGTTVTVTPPAPRTGRTLRRTVKLYD